MKRIISENDEKIYLLVHQDFGGMTYQAAANEIGCDVSTIARAMKRIEKSAPQLPKRLTETEKNIYELIVDHGFTNEEIAIALGKSPEAIASTIRKVADKGFKLHREAKPKMLSYNPNMDDGSIVRKF